MSPNGFQLVNHLPDVLKIAAANKVTSVVALQCLIANLSTMKEYYEGASHLNYRKLGQQWNNLPNGEKVAQKKAARDKLTNAPAKTK